MNIGTASERSGLPAKTIRYYEDIGLLSPAARATATATIPWTTCIGCASCSARAASASRSRNAGNCCRSTATRHRESAEVKAIAEGKLAEIDRKIAELRELRAVLGHLVDACHGDHRPECPILDGLSGQRIDQLSQPRRPQRIRHEPVLAL